MALPPIVIFATLLVPPERTVKFPAVKLPPVTSLNFKNPVAGIAAPTAVGADV